jgi:CheY-like chemotaxis protein
MPEETKKKKILLVEDDVFMIELLAKDLASAGYEVVVAKNGNEGVKKFEESAPDVVLLDILLPDQNGFETLRQIRRHPGGPAAKVMILSNIAEGPDREEAKRLGVTEYLVKANFTLQEIVKKIQEVLVK